MDLPLHARVPHLTAVAAYPQWLWGSLALALISWWLVWFGRGSIAVHVIVPLWLGFILAVDGLTVHRAETSLFARDRVWMRFARPFKTSAEPRLDCGG